MVREEERVKALADYLEVPPDTISPVYSTGFDSLYHRVFETESGEEYLVVDEDEARQAVVDEIENFIDELGIEGFTPSFQDWIIDNASNLDLEDAVREDYKNYASDIESESDDEYGTRLAAECVENGLIDEEDFEDGEYTGDEDLVELLSDHLTDQVYDYREWFESNFGPGELTQLIKNYGSLDYDAIADEAISWDGVGHYLAYYDGDEIELENGLYAYRMN